MLGRKEVLKEAMPQDEPKQYSEEIISAIKALFDYCEKEDQFTRKRHIYESKMADLYWHGFQ